MEQENFLSNRDFDALEKATTFDYLVVDNGGVMENASIPTFGELNTAISKVSMNDTESKMNLMGIIKHLTLAKKNGFEIGIPIVISDEKQFFEMKHFLDGTQVEYKSFSFNKSEINPHNLFVSLEEVTYSSVASMKNCEMDNLSVQIANSLYDRLIYGLGNLPHYSANHSMLNAFKEVDYYHFIRHYIASLLYVLKENGCYTTSSGKEYNHLNTQVVTDMLRNPYFYLMTLNVLSFECKEDYTRGYFECLLRKYGSDNEIENVVTPSRTMNEMHSVTYKILETYFINFFFHKHYPKDFMGCIQNALSEKVTVILVSEEMSSYLASYLTELSHSRCTFKNFIFQLK